MFRASLCPSSGAQEYYTVVAGSGETKQETKFRSVGFFLISVRI